MSQTTVNLGHVPVNRGEYSSSATYYKDNIVQYNGSSYICNVTEEDISHPVGISGVTPYDSDPASPNTGWAVFANDSSGVGEGVYNVSVDHTTDNQPKIYASLSAALNDIPAAKKKGGMEIRFIFNNSNYAVDKEEGITIQPAGTLITSSPTMVDGTYKASQLLTYFSTLPTAKGAGNAVVYYKEVDGTYTAWTITLQSSDNNSTKYVQYRLMSDSFSITEADWQGVDDVPEAGSDNLVKSGGVKEEIQSVNLLKNILEDGFYICDESGKAIVRLDILDSKNGFGPNLLKYIDAIIAQEGLINTIEDGFYICNENGDSIADFKDDKWIFLNAKREIFPGGINVKKETLTTGEELYLTSNAVSLYQNYAFSANIGSNFTKFSIFHGRGSDYSGCRIDVDSTYLKIFLDADATEPTDVFEHHLTLKNTIQLTIDKTLAGNWANHIRLVSNGQTFQVSHHWTGQGDIYVTCEGTLKDCSLSWACRNLLSKVWAFGDSYFSRNVDRWVYYLLKDNYTNVLLDAFPGGTSAAMYAHLISLLELGKPDTVVWCLGMNDGDYSNGVNANWYECYNNLRDLCEKNSINLILSTIPNVPGVRHDYKNEIIRNSGFRYIDFEKSVGATELNSNWFTHTLCAYKNGNDIVYTYHTPTYLSHVGENVYNQNGEVIGTVAALDNTSITYNNVVYVYSSEDNIDGMLSYDDIHPGISGAKTLYGRAIADAPELMSMEAPQYQSNN